MARNELGVHGGLRTFEDLSSDMERIFDSLLGRRVGTLLRSGNGERGERYVPSLDFAETPEAYEVSVDLPGVKPEDVKVEMHDGQLILTGQRSSTKEQKEKNYHRVERQSGSFYRSVGLPTDVDVDKIDAQYDAGVLRVTLPKVEQRKPKAIQVRSAT